MAHYRIQSLESKNTIVRYEMYRENPDGSISWFNLEDRYRWGSGFIAEDMEVNLPNDDAQSAYCKMDEGEDEGCEFEDSVACVWEFSDDIAEEEQERIKRCYCYGDNEDDGRGGVGWLLEGNHDWQFEDQYVQIFPPYKIEFCDERGTVIREVKLRTRDECQKLKQKLGDGWHISSDSGIQPYKFS